MALARNLAFALSMLIPGTSWAQPASPANFSIDPLRSRIEIRVFKGGLFAGLGHDHTVMAKHFSGSVRLDPESMRESSVKLNIDAGSLTVTDPDVSEKERSEIQATMTGSKVLNIQDFPAITFESIRVSGAAAASGESVVQLTGRLNLHGIGKEITFPVRLHAEHNSLQTTGTVSLTQTDFGITPVKAAGGTVRVKDQVTIDFDLSAVRVAP